MPGAPSLATRGPVPGPTAHRAPGRRAQSRTTPLTCDATTPTALDTTTPTPVARTRRPARPTLAPCTPPAAASPRRCRSSAARRAACRSTDARDSSGSGLPCRAATGSGADNTRAIAMAAVTLHGRGTRPGRAGLRVRRIGCGRQRPRTEPSGASFQVPGTIVRRPPSPSKGRRRSRGTVSIYSMGTTAAEINRVALLPSLDPLSDRRLR